MARTQGMTGKAGSMTVNSNVIPITKAEHTLNVEFAKSTDSGNFNPATGEIRSSQLSGESSVELALEGYYDTATTASNLIALLNQPSAGPYPIATKLNNSTQFISGNFDIENFKVTVEIPGATMVNWTATAKSNGDWTIV